MSFPTAPVQDPIGNPLDNKVSSSPWTLWFKRISDFLTTPKFGNDPNYTTFEPDGTMVAIGDATAWNDSMVPASNMRTGGTALVFDTLSGVGATANYQYRFDTLDEVYCTVQMPHNMKINSQIHPHLHIVNRTALTGVASTVFFTLYYAWTNINSNYAATLGVINFTTATVSKNLQNLGQFYHAVVDFGVLTPATNQGNISSILLCKIVRNNVGANVYAGNEIFTLGFDIHYEIDTLGSRLEYTK